MSYAFVDIATIPSLDEYDNPVHLGTGTLPLDADVVLLRPDDVVDSLYLTVPPGKDGQMIMISAMDAVWNINFESVPKSGTTFWIPTPGLNLRSGTAIHILYVAPENRWYVVRCE